MLQLITKAIVLCVLVLAAAGCYSTQEGRVRAGVPFVKDTIVSRYELPLSQVHAAAAQVLRQRGRLTGDDSVTKVLTGVVDRSRVWIDLDDSYSGITEITVQARTTAGVPDVDLASEIDKLIYGLLLQR
jgi:hypothetical protein